ncbi:MAG: Smr/MutS family protein [Bdellovibrionales bacterium]
MSADGDEDLWQAYAKGVKRLDAKEEEEGNPPSPPVLKKPAKPAEKPLFEEALSREEAQLAMPSTLPVPPVWKMEPLDLRVERNMSLGEVLIEGRLDLHGKSEQAAYDQFKVFVENSYGRGKRMLLVITGKGQDGGSVIKNNLPRWCDTDVFEPYVMAVRTAAQQHGGEGAYYILLRKKTK